MSDRTAFDSFLIGMLQLGGLLRRKSCTCGDDVVAVVAAAVAVAVAVIAAVAVAVAVVAVVATVAAAVAECELSSFQFL